MKSKVLGLLAAALMGVSGVGGAAPVLLGTTTDPTGINGLVVDATTYNVAFSTTTLNTFTQGTTLSTDSATALASALNTFGVIALGAQPYELDRFVISVDDKISALYDAADCYAGGGMCATGGWATQLRTGPDTLGQFSLFGVPFYYIAAADFTPAPVPVPAAVWLILSGLAGLGLTGWRRGQTAAV